ncbi:mCG1044125, isoform CRA_a [Mus musculus]|nr:mCG1044125, isoform CRA_a [Mus musculus]
MKTWAVPREATDSDPLISTTGFTGCFELPHVDAGNGIESSPRATSACNL